MAGTNGLSDTDRQALSEISQWVNGIISSATAFVPGLSAVPGTSSSTAAGIAHSAGPGALTPQASDVGGILSQFLSPVVGGLLSFFFRSSEPETESYVPFEMPAALNWNLGVGSSTGGTPQFVDYNNEGPARSAGSAPVGSTQPITIQVQTMDSRSFQDHSREIAEAVRRALLESHSLNDTLQEADLS